MNTRRSLLKTMTAAGALAVWDAPIRYAFASVPTDRRLVVVVLRGALDGLAAVPPHGDKDYVAVRGRLALDLRRGRRVARSRRFLRIESGVSPM